MLQLYKQVSHTRTHTNKHTCNSSNMFQLIEHVSTSSFFFSAAITHGACLINLLKRLIKVKFISVSKKHTHIHTHTV
jgi:hypothetical protein